MPKIKTTPTKLQSKLFKITSIRQQKSPTMTNEVKLTQSVLQDKYEELIDVVIQPDWGSPVNMEGISLPATEDALRTLFEASAELCWNKR